MINHVINDEDSVSSSSNANTSILRIYNASDDLVSSSIDAKDSKGNSSLHRATIKDNNLGKIINLISKGANPNLQNNERTTPIHNAIHFNPESIDYIIQSNYHGINFHARDINGKTYLHHAVETGNIVLTEFILTRCPNLINCQDNKEKTALHMATASNSEALVRILISHRAYNWVRDDSEDIPLHIAVSECNVSIIRLLLNMATEPNIINMRNGLFQETALDMAIEKGNLEIVNELLSSGANPNLQDLWSQTSLHKAAIYNQIILAERLFQSGANPNLQDVWGQTSLHIAAIHNHTILAEKLLQNGAIQNIEDYKGKTPLCCSHTSEMKDLLLSYSAPMQNIQIDQHYNNQYAR